MSRVFRRIATRWIRKDDTRSERKWYRSQYGDLILMGDDGQGDPLSFEFTWPNDEREECWVAGMFDDSPLQFGLVDDGDDGSLNHPASPVVRRMDGDRRRLLDECIGYLRKYGAQVEPRHLAKVIARLQKALDDLTVD